MHGFKSVVGLLFFLLQVSCGPGGAVVEATRALAEDQNIFNHAPLPSLTPSFYQAGAQCESFINEKGELGAYGEIIRDTIHYIISKYPSRKVSLLMDSDLAYDVDGLGDLCPNFPYFNENEKIHFWVWVFAAIAWHESKCATGQNLVGANNPNGLSLGILHMPHDLRYRYDYSNQSLGTGSCREYKPTSGKYVEGYLIKDEAMLNPRLNLKCGIDAMLTSLRGFHTRECYQSWNHILAEPTRQCRANIYDNYWAAFKSESMGIARMIRENPLCGH